MRLTLAALLIAAPAWAEPVPATVLARVAPAVLRIYAKCGNAEPVSGTGFAWGSPGRVVTAFHVVAGCSSVEIYYQGLASVPATIDRVLPSADLALLKVVDPPQVEALTVSTVPPAVGDTVDVYGFPFGQPTRSDAPLYVTDANRETPLLRDAVGGSEREQLVALGIPSLDTEILRVDGNLLPGHSGAPILDHQGNVVAIGSGGLQRGTVGIGWAVRARYLSDLMAAPAGAAPTVRPRLLATSFANVSPETASKRVRCGALSFVKTRTVALQDLLATSDDPGGLLQISASTGEPIQDFADLQFDIWTEPDSGAGIAVPTGGELRSEDARCVARWSDGKIQMNVAGALLNGEPRTFTWQSSVQTVSVVFEQNWAAQFLPFLIQDPRFSYTMAQEHRGGMLVNRKFFMGQQQNGRPPYGIFETIMAKGRAFIGISVVNYQYLASVALPRDQFRAWVAAGFAAHLSTFPP